MSKRPFDHDDDVFLQSPSISDDDPFLTSMTFASMDTARRSCGDCDECRPHLPVSIRLAVRHHKQQRQQHIRRTQVRTLVIRSTAVTVWEWMLPSGAEPLLEFANPWVYRLVWVRHLTHHVHRIGANGVVGSQTETSGRVRLDWSQNDVVLLPPSQKGMGWLVERQESADADDSTASAVAGPAVFLIAKISLKDTSTIETDERFAAFLSTCHKHKDSKEENQKLESDEASQLRDIFKSLSKN